MATSVDWHLVATRPPAEPPAALTVREERALSLPDREARRALQRRWLRNLHVQSTQHAAIHAALSRVAEAASLADHPDCHGLVVNGPATTGKTTAVRRWATAFQRHV